MDLAKFSDYKRPLHLEYQEMLDEYHNYNYWLTKYARIAFIYGKY